jgi:hypothetical protein
MKTTIVPPHPRIGYVGRIVLKDGINYTVTSDTLPEGKVGVWNPQTSTLIVFDSHQTFENWAYGTPVPCGEAR